LIGDTGIPVPRRDEKKEASGGTSQGPPPSAVSHRLSEQVKSMQTVPENAPETVQRYYEINRELTEAYERFQDLYQRYQEQVRKWNEYQRALEEWRKARAEGKEVARPERPKDLVDYRTLMSWYSELKSLQQRLEIYADTLAYMKPTVEFYEQAQTTPTWKVSAPSEEGLKEFFAAAERSSPEDITRALQSIARESEWPASEFTQYALARFLKEKGIKVPSFFTSVYSPVWRKRYEEWYKEIEPVLATAWEKRSEGLKSIRQKMLSEEGAFFIGAGDVFTEVAAGLEPTGLLDLVFPIKSEARKKAESILGIYETTLTKEEYISTALEQYERSLPPYMPPEARKQAIEEYRKRLEHEWEMGGLPGTRTAAAISAMAKGRPEVLHGLIGLELARIGTGLLSGFLLGFGISKLAPKVMPVLSRIKLKGGVRGRLAGAGEKILAPFTAKGVEELKEVRLTGKGGILSAEIKTTTRPITEADEAILKLIRMGRPVGFKAPEALETISKLKIHDVEILQKFLGIRREVATLEVPQRIIYRMGKEGLKIADIARPERLLATTREVMKGLGEPPLPLTFFKIHGEEGVFRYIRLFEPKSISLDILTGGERLARYKLPRGIITELLGARKVRVPVEGLEDVFKLRVFKPKVIYEIPEDVQKLIMGSTQKLAPLIVEHGEKKIITGISPILRIRPISRVRPLISPIISPGIKARPRELPTIAPKIKPEFKPIHFETPLMRRVETEKLRPLSIIRPEILVKARTAEIVIPKVAVRTASIETVKTNIRPIDIIRPSGGGAGGEGIIKESTPPIFTPPRSPISMPRTLRWGWGRRWVSKWFEPEIIGKRRGKRRRKKKGGGLLRIL